MKVAVIGAGAAGYFTAAAIARNCNADVTVYHDPMIPSIGVGESIAWGAPDFVRNVLGIEDEFEFMRKSNATFKFAARLQGWTEQNDKGFLISYPFAGSSKLLERSPLGGYIDLISHNDEHSLYDVWMHLYSRGLRTKEQSRGDMNEYHWFAKMNTVPVDETGKFSTLGYLGHSYHVDAGVIGPVVQEMSGKQHGVKEVAQAVKQVNVGTNGIESIILDNDDVIKADLYIDCTGFERRLMSELDNKFVTCDEYFNNSALVGPLDYTSGKEICSYTTMQALPNGWNFNVPINYRSGNGYIFNSRFGKSTDELVSEYESITGRKDIIKRHLTWTPGYYEQCMYKNCIALGISYGFSEAFDANGFSSTISYIKRLIKHLGTDDQGTFDWRNDFNYYTNSLVEDIKFRIQCAMHLAPRNDSEYWQEMKVAAKKFNTLEKLQDTIHSDERKKYLGYQNKMYSQHTFITTALYYGIDLQVPDWNIDERIKELALNWFGFFNNRNKILAQTSPSTDEFYTSTIYKNLEFKK
jgi:hypothetical protein